MNQHINISVQVEQIKFSSVIGKLFLSKKAVIITFDW